MSKYKIGDLVLVNRAGLYCLTRIIDGTKFEDWHVQDLCDDYDDCYVEDADLEELAAIFDLDLCAACGGSLEVMNYMIERELNE